MPIHTKLSESDIKDFCSQYGVELSSYEEITTGGNINSNFKINLKNHDDPVVLTIGENFPPNGITAEDMAWTIRLLNHIDGNKLQKDINNKVIKWDILSPLQRSDGKNIGMIKGKPAALVSFVKGEQCSTKTMTPKMACEMGRALAAFHKASEGFNEPREMGYDVRKHQQWTDNELKSKDPENTERWQSVSDALKVTSNKWESHTKDLRHGVCYGDFMPQNMMIDSLVGRNEKLNLLDVWNGCNDSPQIFDAAIWMAITAPFNKDNNGQVDKDILLNFLDGYDEVRPLTPEEKSEIPYMVEAATAYLAIHVARANVTISPTTGKPISTFPPEKLLSEIELWRDEPPITQQNLENFQANKQNKAGKDIV